ncbi:SGNH/GDSL hydrolase family protein [Hydrogenophaga pseudoflava]|uniref:SGNH/GDSL hydrolase family protein n=1 Tax=Hydrogenophaga pseudoflava TaxID=47421 RepID=UPI0027E533F6|nr:SGNH/GDSL hydrolase family protein [Hydrogenophaga pseudoflava]MDQ7744469.1 SGNH/GDSL hydrolase family protein [Hydrogenophaga pseudoflava]
MTHRFFAHACLVSLSALLSACGGGGGDDEAAGGGSSAEKVASCGLNGGPLRIMPLGDSITEGEAGHNSYRRVLWQRLNGAGCSVNLVGSKSGVSRGSRDSGSVQPPNADFDLDHEGYWDYSVNELTPRVGGLVAQAEPDVVLVHLGTNDVLGGQSANGIAQELGALIDGIRAGKPDTHILLAKIIPAAPDPAGTAALNRLIDGLASGRSTSTSPIAVVNQASGYSTGDNYDGVHPGPGGESKLGNRWADAVLAWRTR